MVQLASYVVARNIRQARPVQLDSIKTRVESAYGFSA